MVLVRFHIYQRMLALAFVERFGIGRFPIAQVNSGGH
jgi:hypothetical protein